VKTKSHNLALTEEERSCLREFDSGYESHLSQVDDPIPGTCGWILNHEKWVQFDSTPTSTLLWITADAGCGKSVAAKHLFEHHKSRRNVCYFFFKDGFEYQNNAQSALSAILHQIYCFQPSLLKHAMAKHDTTPKRTFKQFACLQSMLMSTIEDESFRDTLCIIDGLDECEPKSRDLLVKCLATYFTIPVQSNPGGQGPFKMVILSRPDNLIQRRLQLFGKDTTEKNYPGLQRKSRLMAEDEVIAIAKDINLFIRAKIEEFGPKSELSEDVLAKVENRLIDGADFTFLWVSLVVKLLEDAEVDGISKEQLEAILRTTNLDDVYRRLLTARKFPLKTRKILYIVIAAARPLTLEEMCVAVEVHQDYYPRDSEGAGSDRVGYSTALSAADMHSAGPSQSYGKVLELEILSSKLCKPFANHLRLLCGHFIRIRANRVYLVHQTAKKFLLDTQPLIEFGLGHYLRPFGWKIERPTVAELKYLKHQNLATQDQPPQWEHSIRLDVATRYLLQVCVDYIQLFDTSREEAFKLGMTVSKYLETHSDEPEWALLTYASVYWVEHYRELRKDLRNCFDFMFNPKFIRFKIWSSRYLGWSREDANRSPKHTSGMPISAQQIVDIGNKSTIGPPDMYSEEEKFQRILDFFNLGGEDTELYDEEYLDGDHYWKETAKAQDEGWEDDSGSESPDDRLKVSIPDRIQHFRRQHRNVVQEKIRESWDPMSPGSMNPTSVKSLDMHFKKQGDGGQAGALTVKKGGFGTGEREWKGRGREEIYDREGRSTTAAKAYGRNRPRRSSLEGLNDEEDEWKSPLDF
jgi:protein SERAC1